MEKLRRDVSDKGISAKEIERRDVSDKEILDSNVERRDVSGRVILDNKVEKSEVSGKNILDKREKEKELVSQMISLYCRKNHKEKDAHNKFILCRECEELENYARMRSDKCPFMETKTFCSNCKVHCYKPAMRERIKEVMRFSGPRMLFVHPVVAVRHVLETKKEKRRLEKEEKK